MTGTILKADQPRQDDGATTGTGRIASLDQFRGWAISAMILVNYLGHYNSMPEAFRHHREGMTFADIVVPAFLFAVGIGYRLTFLRRMQSVGIWSARWAAVRRYVTLIIVGYLVYGVDYGEPHFWAELNWNFWDALVDIGFAGLLALPFIERGPATRLCVGLLYCGIFQGLYDFAGYGEWVRGNSIDGGPLGPLTQAFPLLLGTVAYDLLALRDRKRFIAGALVLGIVCAAVGYGLSFRWVFSQRYGTASYLIFSAGVCMLIYLAFYLIADVGRFSIPTLTPIGRNALTLYVAQQFLLEVHRLPETTPALTALAAFAALYAALYAAARYLDRSGYYIRL